MNLTGGIVLFAVIWFLVFLVALQLHRGSQAEAGKIVPGTPEGAPANVQMKRKVIWTTMITIVLWASIAATILSGAVTLKDIDWFNRMDTTPPSDQG